MTQNTLLTLSFLLAAAFILAPSHIEAKCNLCSDYGIACINETSFNLCFGGKQDTSKVYDCPADRLCSATSLKCIEASSGGKAACEPNKGCGVCDGDKIFACTSRTTFAQCNGEELTEITGVCPKGLTCNSEGSEICVDECNRPNVFECDREA
ncbi:uncharacterized protein LOC135954787 [Calliphora vicina]|uniref:uncharacterized protein LOC135954787 n=1 Tax=Calliphora vicina TaxID=7373 RepID=UPI00325B60F3